MKHMLNFIFDLINYAFLVLRIFLMDVTLAAPLCQGQRHKTFKGGQGGTVSSLTPVW